MFNQQITSNNIVGKTTTKQQNGKSSIEEEIDREFEEAQKEIDAMLYKVDNYSAEEYYNIDDLWYSDKLNGRGLHTADF